MNELQEKILALLVAKFQGVRKDGLQQLAAAIGLQVASEEEANQVVDKLTADKVNGFVTEWRRTADAEIKKANDTYEEGLRRKYDFKEKNTPDPNPAPDPNKPADGGAVTLDAISKLIDSKRKGVESMKPRIQNLKMGDVAKFCSDLTKNLFMFITDIDGQVKDRCAKSLLSSCGTSQVIIKRLSDNSHDWVGSIFCEFTHDAEIHEQEAHTILHEAAMNIQYILPEFVD